MKAPKMVDVESVETIEQYLMQIGLLGISLHSLESLQDVAIRKGFLTEDAQENCLTISYEIGRLLTVINDQLKICTSQTGIAWPELMNQIVKLLPEDRR